MGGASIVPFPRARRQSLPRRVRFAAYPITIVLCLPAADLQVAEALRCGVSIALSTEAVMQVTVILLTLSLPLRAEAWA